MKVGDLASYAVANLRRHKLRTGLTLCGVGVGVATLTVLVSLASGLERVTSSQFNQAELVTRIGVLRKGTKAGLKRGFLPGATEAEGSPITDEVVDELREIDGVVSVYPEVNTIVCAEANFVGVAWVEGLPTDALTGSHRSTLLAGDYWDDDSETNVVVIPSLLLEDLRLGAPKEAIGQEVHFSNLQNRRRYKVWVEETPDPAGGKPFRSAKFERPKDVEITTFKIVGVYDSKKFGYAGRYFHVPLPEAKRLVKDFGYRRVDNEDEYQRAWVKVGSHEDVERVAAAIEDKDFDTQTIFDILEQIKVVFTFIQVVFGFFGVIGLTVAFFGIANTMVMAVLERTREIGVLKALGARNRDIRRLFLGEAAGIGVLGGALGVAAGWLMGVILNALISVFAGEGADLPGLFYIEWWLPLICIGLAVVVATVAGVYPAWRAARMDPVESLRRE